jgi:hypothetical protein
LAHERFVARSFSDLNRAIAEARAMPPHALVVEEGFVSGMARVLSRPRSAPPAKSAAGRLDARLV